MHLPDILKETSKLLNDFADDGLMKSQDSWTDVQKVAAMQEDLEQQSADKREQLSSQKFFKPFPNSQLVAFPEQARIFKRKLEILKYDLVDGLIEALSRRIRTETNSQNAIQELTLDQNNLSDGELAKLLTALFEQGKKFEQACQTINISNNEFGPLSAEALMRFFEFQHPDSLHNLRLSNLKISDTLLTDLFECLKSNEHLQILRLSGITMS